MLSFNQRLHRKSSRQRRTDLSTTVPAFLLWRVFPSYEKDNTSCPGARYTWMSLGQGPCKSQIVPLRRWPCFPLEPQMSHCRSCIIRATICIFHALVLLVKNCPFWCGLQQAFALCAMGTGAANSTFTLLLGSAGRNRMLHFKKI